MAVLLSGCVGDAVTAVAKAPFKVTSVVWDTATTSQAEADRNRGRKMRQQDEYMARRYGD
ncbi:hypothetical protein [Novosphingobium ovatum]|nr:hypothetical protein [Novosphingobium ovatum]